MTTRLEQLRIDRGEDRQTVSRATGVPYSTLIRLEENASTKVNLTYLRALADYYGQPLDVVHLLGV
jgi:transcriptional regulator with XRE-family HTH domain